MLTASTFSHRFRRLAGGLAAVAAAAALVPTAASAATVVIGGSPTNAAICATLGAQINGLEGQAASNPKAASLQQTANTLKVIASGAGCYVGTV
jgi:hypothetical protein